MTNCYRFDRFELRPARRQLLEGGVEIDIGGRAFDLLVALVERRDRIVTRDELHALVWPNLSVEPNNLHVQIWRLRGRLGDRIIRTVARKGYQFAAETEAVVQPPAAGQVPAWFEPPSGGGGGAGSASDASFGSRLDDALRHHRLIAFVHVDDVQRRRLLEIALAALPADRRRGTLHYDGAELARCAADTVESSVAACAPTVLPHLARAAARARLRPREQLLVLQDAHLAPDQVTSMVDAVLHEPGHVRVVLATRAPLGLPGEHVLAAGTEARAAAIPAPTPGPATSSEPHALHDPCLAATRPLRWRARGTAA